MECFEPLGGLQQQNRCVAPGHGCPLDLPPELLDAGPLQIVDRVGFGLGQQAERGLERACVQVREGGCQRSFGAPGRLDGQGERPLEEGRRGRQPGTGLSLDRRLLERGGHVLVRPGGRGGQVAHPAIRIGLSVRRRGEHQVGGAAVLGGPGCVGGLSHQRVPEPDVGTDLEQLVSRARQGGVALGDVISGSRKRPDGTVLAWRYTDPGVVVADRLVPYFIDWGDSPHPAATAPRGVTLVALRAEHPDATRVRSMLGRIGLDLPIQAGPRAALIATLDSPRGRVQLGP